MPTTSQIGAEKYAEVSAVKLDEVGELFQAIREYSKAEFGNPGTMFDLVE